MNIASLRPLDSADGHDESSQAFEASLLSSDQIAALPPPEWLIRDYLQKDRLALLYGPPGACKTFLALDWALHVATGSWWHQRAIEQPGRVLYVIAEGASGIGPRLDAWRQHHKVYDLNQHEPITWRPEAVNLFDRTEAELLADAADWRQPALIVLDTLARCMVGADENSAKDTGTVIAHLDLIRRRCGACILVVHHTGKDASAGARGSSALKGAVDTELELTAVDHRLVLRNPKQKDAPEAPPLRLDRLPVGDSCALVPGGRVSPSEDLTAGALATLEALRSVQVPGGVPTTTWMKNADCSDRTFYRHRALLIERGLVDNAGTDAQPRYLARGDEEATHDLI